MLRRFETNRAPVQKRLKAKNLRDAIKTIHGAGLATLLRLGFTTAALRETVLGHAPAWLPSSGAGLIFGELHFALEDQVGRENFFAGDF